MEAVIKLYERAQTKKAKKIARWAIYDEAKELCLNGEAKRGIALYNYLREGGQIIYKLLDFDENLFENKENRLSFTLEAVDELIKTGFVDSVWDCPDMIGSWKLLKKELPNHPTTKALTERLEKKAKGFDNFMSILKNNA